MKLTYKILLITISLCMATVLLYAQKELEIQKVFDTYGKKRGSVMIKLTNEKLGKYEFLLFQSLSISYNTSTADFIRLCLEKDKQIAKKVKEVTVDGVVKSVFLELKPKENIYRLLLFNQDDVSRKLITLIYIESEDKPEDILNFILK